MNSSQRNRKRWLPVAVTCLVLAVAVPAGWAVPPDPGCNIMWVADPGGAPNSGRLVQFNFPAGTPTGTTAGGTINNPWGLAAHPTTGDIYVTASTEILYYDGEDGTYLGTIGGSLNDPHDIDFDSSGNLYVGNKGANNVLKWNGSSWSTAKSGMNLPRGIACLGTDWYVGEGGVMGMMAPCPDEPTIYKNGSWFADGNCFASGPLNMPNDIQSLAIDTSGNLYATVIEEKMHKWTSGGSGPSTICSNNVMGNVDYGPDGMLYYVVPVAAGNHIYRGATTSCGSLFINKSNFNGGPQHKCWVTVAVPTEACCNNDGSCTDDDPTTCSNNGGTPQGPGTDCATTARCDVAYSDFRGGPDVTITGVGGTPVYTRVKPYSRGGTEFFMVMKKAQFGECYVFKHLPASGTHAWSLLTKWAINMTGGNGRSAMCGDSSGNVYVTYNNDRILKYNFSNFSGTPGGILYEGSANDTRYYIADGYPIDTGSGYSMPGINICQNGRIIIGHSWYDVNLGSQQSELLRYNGYTSMPTTPGQRLAQLHHDQQRASWRLRLTQLRLW